MYAETSSRHHSETCAIAFAPRWFDPARQPLRQPPAALRPWLFAAGSLTRHLTAAADGDFHVERLRQYWARPTLSEARLLDSDPSRHALIREVILWGRGQPWVYARSVLPLQLLTGDLRRLRRLRDASLGALLFRYPGLTRTPFELARVETTTGSQPLWGRRSRFAIGARSLIVGEIFLDAFVTSDAVRRHP